jgi:formate-dependent nitrite reductase membrane component NrfD
MEALGLILGGEFTTLFWVWFVALGLLLPLALELVELRGSNRALVFIAPLLVLFGGYMLRQVTVDMGQVSTWSEYAIQFDPALLQRLY